MTNEKDSKITINLNTWLLSNWAEANRLLNAGVCENMIKPINRTRRRKLTNLFGSLNVLEISNKPVRTSLIDELSIRLTSPSHYITGSE